MNKKRREELKEALQRLDDAKGVVENALYDEDDYAESMPDNLKFSMKYEDSQTAIDFLQEAITHIEGATESVLEAMQ